VAILIKRYANRKLYNTDSSRYITLKGVGELLDRGEDVRVVDNETGEDITEVALSQILVDNKRAREAPSETLLTQILSRGGDAVYSAIRRSVDDASDGLGEFQERFRQLVQPGEPATGRGRPFAWTGSGPPPGHAATPGDGAFARGDGRTRPHAAPSGEERDERDDAGHAGPDEPLADRAHSILESVARALGRDDWPRRADFERLNRNLERVAAALERLENALEKNGPRS